MKTILLTFDVEEADILREYNIIDIDKEFILSKEGLLLVRNLLLKHNIKTTFFTTANFAKKYPKIIKDLSKEHEIACHGYNHSDNYTNERSFVNIKKAKKEIEDVSGANLVGFRAPRFEIKNIEGLYRLGFFYDSSMHPTLISGRYINLSKKRKVDQIKQIMEITPSILPIFRLPITWIFFRNLGVNYAKIFTKINFLSSNYTMLLFHPWEFADLKTINLPRYIKRNSGQTLMKMLEKYILFCRKKGYVFDTIANYLERFKR